MSAQLILTGRHYKYGNGRLQMYVQYNYRSISSLLQILLIYQQCFTVCFTSLINWSERSPDNAIGCHNGRILNGEEE